MMAFIIVGAVMAIAGLGGVLWCIRQAAWLRKAELPEDKVRGELNELIFAHMAAIGSAFLGLGLLVVGLLLN